MRFIRAGKIIYPLITLRLAGITSIAVIVVFLVSNMDWYRTIQELVFDQYMSLSFPISPERAPVVVDIDRASIDNIGAWPWRRDKLAKLLNAIALQKPKLIALDILLEGSDELSPAAMARKLATETGDAHVAELADRVIDGDRDLAQAIGAGKTVLGAVLNANPSSTKLLPPVLVRGRLDMFDLWQAEGLIAPPDQLLSVAKGVGLIAIPGDNDGLTRRLPLLAGAGRSLLPSLAVEMHRVRNDATALVVSQSPRTLLAGELKIDLPQDGMLRLLPARAEAWRHRTVSAQQILEGDVAATLLLKGAIVLVGSSAAEAGGLRPAARGVLAPTVQLQADAYSQLSLGIVPIRPIGLEYFEIFAAALAGLFGAFAGYRLTFRVGLALSFGLVAVLAAVSLGAYSLRFILVDSIIPGATAIVCFVALALMKAAETMRREAAIRRRFEQHLAPEVARRIIAQPELLRLAGEMREVTALFTDVEGFTAMTDRAQPQQLIAVLDAYFDGVSRIVIEHGGLIDKIVGDAVHALFNVPIDLANHPRAAFECALAIEGFAKEFRNRPLALKLCFGRTRMGLETGLAIVGDVGGSRKLDYTAHGNAVNAAARLEALNKEFRSTLCIGETAAAFIGIDSLRPLGFAIMRGREESQRIYTTWPELYSVAGKQKYIAALALSRTNVQSAIELLQDLRLHHEDDAVLQSLIERFSATRPDPIKSGESAMGL